MERQREQASAWFTSLRDTICTAFERLEDEQTRGCFADRPAGRFERRKTTRDGTQGGGGGVMSILRDGRLFEKVGVNISTVYGAVSPNMMQAMTARKALKGLNDDPRFWASGISLVAHMNSPKTPAVHMNTRLFWTPVAHWFGGGADLNPMLPHVGDRDTFHAYMRTACDAHNPDYYEKFKAWADKYFMIKHWNEPRGVGGIFYDDLNSGDFDADFAFTQSVGRAFLEAFLDITRKHRFESWSEQERETQLIKRGRYAEFNLIYDRGTTFGLQSGHDPSAVLMSLPPVAKWP